MKFRNLFNKKFGLLTPKKYLGLNYWQCKCDCGNHRKIRGYDLLHGLSPSCGCSKRKDEKGKRYGKLLVLKELKTRNKYRLVLWKCKCNCGNIKIVSGFDLRQRNVNSCGCLIKKKKFEVAFNCLFRRIKNNALIRNLKFSLSKKDIIKTSQQNCYYCGSKPSMEIKGRKNGNKYYFHNGSIKYNGIDRVNNSIGYIKSNIVSCCKICNRAKNNLSYDEFLTWIKKIKKYNLNNIK